MLRFLLVCLLFFFFLLPKQSLAAEPFKKRYAVTYAVAANGTTKVTYDIALVNTAAQLATAYTIDLGFSDIRNVKVNDTTESLPVVIKETQNGKQLHIQFKKKIVGKGTAVRFSVAFETDGVAKLQGKVWEITIPGIKKGRYDIFSVFVTAPASLGTPLYVKPPLIDPSELHFTKEQLESSGISIVYGIEQVFDFSLSYHIKNNNFLSTTKEIALPAYTNYQDIAIDTLDPAPQNVRIDNDGNWLAGYLLDPGEKKDIVVKGQARLLLNPRKQSLSLDDTKRYLQQKRYWQVADSNIAQRAQELKTPENIYRFVASHLTYDFSRVTKNQPRLGALSALQNPNSAVCLEFTDLFIAIARAAGIPAREVNGFAYTENKYQQSLTFDKDILHVWPEYYDTAKERWIMVDPTWGNTTDGTDYFHIFDLNHIAFVIKGLDSQLPLPAGAYKTSVSSRKDIQIKFAEVWIPDTQRLEVNAALSESALAGIPFSGTITIKNLSRLPTTPNSYAIQTDDLLPSQQKIFYTQIPPFGTQAFPFSLSSQSFLTNHQATVRIHLGGNTVVRTVQITPIFFSKQGIIGGIIICAIIATLSIITAKTRRLPFFRQKR